MALVSVFVFLLIILGSYWEGQLGMFTLYALYRQIMFLVQHVEASTGNRHLNLT